MGKNTETESGFKRRKANACVPAEREEREELAALLAAIKTADQAALSRLYDLTVARVAAVARHILRSKEDAEEVVCDVYVQVWEQAGAYDPRRGSVMAWLIVMAKNRAIDRCRNRRVHVSLDDESASGLTNSLAADGHNPEDLLSLFQSGSAVHAALSALTPLRRRLLGLAFFQGLSHQEIAQLVELPLGTIKSHVRRALATLQSVLAAHP